ncbi:hypothetical protein ABW19_dt0206296 [Dactylella cylindrospora]|nr:hypothetical protein ABW19_dt0206296 [Dactylella cylindrospora]
MQECKGKENKKRIIIHPLPPTSLTDASKDGRSIYTPKPNRPISSLSKNYLSFPPLEKQKWPEVVVHISRPVRLSSGADLLASKGESRRESKPSAEGWPAPKRRKERERKSGQSCTNHCPTPPCTISTARIKPQINPNYTCKTGPFFRDK